MSKSGQARLVTSEEFRSLLDEVQNHRYPEKNTAILQISFKLGLRAQEIALLQLKEVCQLERDGSFKLHEVMSLPAAITKGADAMKRSKSKYDRKTLSFNILEFNNVIKLVEKLAKAGAEIKPPDFYPALRLHKGKSRDLPLVDKSLRAALIQYLFVRLDTSEDAKPGDPLFITQKKCAYSPNTLQEHMAMMLRHWGGIEKASSHSGRRTLLTNVIHKQNKPLKVAQKIAGHKNPSTTIIYTESTEEEIAETLANVYSTH